MSLDVLADDGLLVGAGDVVPLDAVAVEVVEHGKAGLGLAALAGLAVVGLADAGAGTKRMVFSGDCFTALIKVFHNVGN